MNEDSEISAMRIVAEALEPIDSDARIRVLTWAGKRFAVELSGFAASGRSGGEAGVQGARFESFADLYDAAAPATDVRKALVGGYWFQIVQRAEGFTSQEVNDRLKDLGHALGNVTRAFDHLREQVPALALQIQKSGKSRQARKVYKLTQAGIREVESMLRGESSTRDS